MKLATWLLFVLLAFGFGTLVAGCEKPQSDTGEAGIADPNGCTREDMF